VKEATYQVVSVRFRFRVRVWVSGCVTSFLFSFSMRRGKVKGKLQENGKNKSDGANHRTGENGSTEDPAHQENLNCQK
jgi:hypothetical protein